MTNPITLLRQGLLALMLAGASLGAMAAPIYYHVDLDTTLAGSTSGVISFQFAAIGAPAPLTATVSNFTGATNGQAPTSEVAIDANGNFVIANDFSYADVAAMFGGLFSFDVAFSGDLAGVNGSDSSTLVVSLLDENLNTLLGDGLFGVVRFEILPVVGAVPVDALAGVVGVTAVPEPGNLALMLMGIAMLGFTVRRKMRG